MGRATPPWQGQAISDRRILFAATPVAIAIGVYGIVFGATASAEYGVGPTVAMSLLVFSGTVQFAVVGLLANGVGLGAVVLTVVALNARNLVLGAALRPRVDGTRSRRALMSWFLVDEGFGLSVASGRQAARVLVGSGILFYLSWQVGTFIGVAGAQAVVLEDLAAAVFPVLFIGLAAITATRRSGALRVAASAGIVLVGTILVPDLHPFLPIVAALLVALPGPTRR